MDDVPGFLEVNLKIFGKFCPAYVQRVREAKSSHLQFCETDRGECNLCKSTHGTTEYYHSQEGALEEAQQWFQKLTDIQNVETLFVFGVGLGYYYDAAQHWLEENSCRFLVFLEDDLAVLHAFFQTKHATEIFSHPQVIVLAFQSSSEEKRELIPSDLAKVIEIFSHVPYEFSQLKSYEEKRRRLYGELQLYFSFRFGVVERETTFFQEDNQKKFSNNFFHNIFSLPQSYLAHRLLDEFPKVPAIICGAGPSLKKQCSLLKQVKDKALIFGAGTAMNVLNKEGIIAHFGAAVDHNEASKSRIMTNFAYETPYFYENKFYQDAYELLHGPRLYFKGLDFFGIETWFNDQLALGKWEPIPYFVSTTAACLAIALALGCDPIIFVGLDLAYTDEQLYPKNVTPHPLDNEMIKNQISKIPYGRTIPARGYDGGNILTRVDWLHEASKYAECVQQHPHVTFLNATEGGMHIPKIPHKPFRDVVNEDLGHSFDLDNWVHAQIQISERMPVKDGDIVKSFEKWEKILRAWINTFRQFIRQLRTTSLTELVSLEKKLEEQIDEMKYLRQMNQMFTHLILRETYLIDYRPEMLTEEEMYQKKSNIALTRAVFLQEVIKWQLSSMRHALNQHQETRLDEFSVITSKPQPEMLEGEVYSFNGQELVIIDPELDLSYRAPFSPDGNEKKEGRCLTYHANGAIQRKWYTFQGKLHGPSTFYSKEGRQLAKGWFLDGVRQGKNWQYYLSGSLYSLQRFLDGARHGRQEYFYENGTEKTVMNYREGQFNGLVQLYHPNGQLKREISFLNGQLHGTEKMWNVTGQRVLEAEYAHGKPKGRSRSWHSNGERKQEVIYYDSPDHCDLYRWDKGGRLLEKKLYFAEELSKETIEKTQKTRSRIARLKIKIEELKKKKKHD